MSDKLTAEAEQNLKQFASCILDFVMELDGYRQTCIRHDKSTAVTLAKNGTLWLRKKYELTDDVQETVDRTVGAMEDWKESPWWHKWDTWDDLKERMEKREKPLVCTGVHWEGWPMLVCITVSEKSVTIATASPAVGSETLPELPLRKAAMALRCHEHIVPEWLAKPQEVQKRKNGDYPIHGYLRKTSKEKDDPVHAMIEKWPN